MKSAPSDDVARWVVEAQRGSSDAFNCLYRHFVALVHGILLSRFRRTVAEELTQDCFLAAFQKLNQLREPKKFGPWIAAIARRVESLEEHREGFELDDASYIDPGAAPESIVDATTILDAIRKLSDTYRETLVLRLVEGMSGAEIAEATGLNPDSVRVNLHRGMKQLREALAIEIDGPNK